MTNIKPIFEQERIFFKHYTGVELPKHCWRKSTKIYLDCTCDKPLYQFKVLNGEIKITKDNTDLFTNYQQKQIDELIKLYDNNLSDLEEKSINKIVQYIDSHKEHEYIVSHSGGKDSSVTYYIWKKAIQRLNQPIDYIINFANTSNDTADTYKLIKSLPKDKIKTLNPKLGFYQWIISTKKYFIPSIFARNCCSTYKEGQIKKHYDKKKDITMVLGVRKYESVKRSKYDYVMDHDFRCSIHKVDNLPKKWINLAPIVEWRDEEIWLYILREQLKYNTMYNKGFSRVGCLICPNQQDYVDLLIQYYYPKQWERWCKILRKNYELYRINRRLQWTFEEWKNGKWKQGKSKVQFITEHKMTDERVLQVSNILGVSSDMAKKYWRKCKCGKKLNPTETAMYLKLIGRYEGELDNRRYLCKKCLCEYLNMSTTEYAKLTLKFFEEGCNLF